MAGASKKNLTIVSKRRNQRGFRRIIVPIACLVAIAISVVLMVPAVSMTRGDLVCGMEEHAHTKDCYEQVLTCGLEEGEGAKPATDDEPAVEGHKHTKDCYEKQLVCDKPEHKHVDSCYAEPEAEPEPENSSDAVDESGSKSKSDESGSAGQGNNIGNDSNSKKTDNQGENIDLDDEDSADSASGEEVAQSFEADLKDKDGKSVLTVSVEAPKGALPEGATMKIDGIDAKKVWDPAQAAVKRAASGDEDMKKAMERAGATDEVSQMAVVDIVFRDAEGNVIEPAKKLKVRITSDMVRDMPHPVHPFLARVTGDRDAKDDAKKYADAEMVLKKVKVVNRDASDESKGSEDTVAFKADKFGPYAIMQLADAEAAGEGDEGSEGTDLDGKTFEFGIPKGGFVSMEQLVEALGIAKAESEGDFVEKRTANELMLDSEKISEESRELVADIESVEFSDSGLAWVGKAESDTTVGALKEANSLDCEYSEEPTQEAAAEVDAAEVAAGDWGIVSLKEFEEPETLTVTMNNDDVFKVQMTYAQIKKTVIDAKGDTWEITVTYGEDAQIPNNAELRVREIQPEDQEYSEIFNDADAALREEKDTGLTTPVVFDIDIVAGDEEIEPAEGSVVDVEIKLVKGIFDEEDTADEGSQERVKNAVYYNGIAIEDNGQAQEGDEQASDGSEAEEDGIDFDVIHLNNEGNAEIIDGLASDAEEDSYVLTFATDSFSSYIVNGDTENGKNYFLNSLPSTMYVGDTVYLYYLNTWDEGNKTVNGNNGVAIVYTPVSGNNQFREVRVENTGTFWIGDKEITVLPKQSGSHPDTVSTLANDSIGVKMNMYDYDLDDSLDSHFNQFGNSIEPYRNAYRDDGINNGHSFKFWGSGIGTWGANSGNNPSGVKLDYNQYDDGARTGIVQSTLSGGYPMLRDREETLSYLFAPSNGTDKAAYPGVDGLFQKDADGYYYYDSNKNYAWLNTATSKFEVYPTTYHQWSNSDASAAGGYDNGKAIGFFPFHEWNDSYDLFVNWNKNLNHHFGMEFDLSFSLPNVNENMAVVDRNGKPIVFEFSGDDDVWVFVDDKLVMDIGGVHQPVAGKIDFTNRTVVLTDKNGNVTNQTDYTSWDTLLDGQPHTLKMFYVERGGCDSNNMIKFNLTHYTDIEFEKLDKLTEEPIAGVTYELWEVIRYNDDEGNPQVKYEQAFWWENRNGSAVRHPQTVTTEADGKVSFKHVPVGEYILKEVSAPNEYILNEDKTLRVTLQKNGDGTFSAVWNKDALDELDADGVQVTNKRPVIDISVEKKWLDVDGRPMDASEYSATFTLHRTKSWTEIVQEEGEPEKTSTLNLGYVNGSGQYGIYQDYTYSNFVEGSTVTINYNYDDSHLPQWNNYRYYKIGQNGEQHNLDDTGSFTVTMPPAGETLTVYFYDGFNNNPYWSGSDKYFPFTSLSATGRAPQNTIIEHEIPHVDESDSFTKTLTLSNGVTSGKFYSGLYSGTPDEDKFPYQETVEQPDGTKITYTYKYYITEEPVAGFSSSPSQAGPTGDEDYTGEFENRKLMSVKIKKEWDHGTNQGEHPTSLTVTLSNGQTATLNEANNWEATITDLPKYDSEGHEISYSWTEESLPAGYYLSNISEQTSGDVAITTLTNTFTDHYMPETTITGKKIWNDNGDENRPESITVNLYQGNSATPYRTISVNAPIGDGANQDEWPFEFTNLPIFSDDGTVIQYRVEEVLPEGYAGDYNIKTEFSQATYIPGTATGTIVNSGEGSQTFEVSEGVDLGYIVIRHGNDFIVWTPRPATEDEIASIKDKVVTLSEQFNRISTASGNSLKIISGVPKTVDVGNKHAVSVYMQDGEVWMKFLNPNAWSDFVYGTIPYTYTPAGGDGGGTITNVKKVINISGAKTWVDDGRVHNNSQEITLTLKRTIKPVTEDSNWETVEVQDGAFSWDGNTYMYSDLPRYQDVNDPATEYEYKVEEAAVNVAEGTGSDQKTIAYAREDDGNGNFTNTELIDIEATKTWKDGDTNINSTIMNATVTFKLQKKVGAGEWIDVPEVAGELENPQTLAVGNTANQDAWKAEWSNLPRYEMVEGTAVEVQYQVIETEAKISGFDVKPQTNPTALVTDGAANIDNALPKTEMSVTKQWKDGTTASGGNDKVFDETKTINFTVYQKIGSSEAAVYTAYGDNGKGSVTYTPGEGENAGSWSVEVIQDLPKYAYDEAANAWSEASYYVVEDDISGVTVAYQKGAGEASDAADAAVGNDDAEANRTITIINTDILVPIRIVKVDKDNNTGLSGASFQLTRKLPGEGGFTKFEHSSFAIDPENDGKQTGPFTVSSDDGIILEGLRPGEYRIEEKTAPTGYVIDLQPFTFTLEADGSVSSSDADQTLVLHLEKEGEAPEGFRIGNTPGEALPNTGGSGTWPLTLLGMVMIAGAGMLLWMRRRSSM